MVRQVGRPREFDEEKVLFAAMEAFWHKGYEATSLTDLTEKTGLNKASLYRFFGDKHALFKAALKNYADSMIEKVEETMSESSSPLENVRAVARKIAANCAHEKGCLMVNSLVELGPHDQEIAELLRKFDEQRIRDFTDLIDQARNAGEVRSELDPSQLARSLMITLAGSATLAKEYMSEKVLFENLDFIINSWT